jgi:hypothetical protein
MAQPSPILEGFHAVFRRPTLALAEITWRWAFGAAAWTLILFLLVEYLDTLPVTPRDVFFLRTRHPHLISQAIAHILSGSAQGLVTATLIVAAALTISWIFVASLGRAFTLKHLLDYLGMTNSAGLTRLRTRFWRGKGEGWRLRSLLGLNFLRATLGLAAVLGILASATVAGFASSDSYPRPGLAFLIFVPLALLVVLLWSAVNWFLSLAPVFVLHDSQDAFGSISRAVEFCYHRASAVAWSSTAFGLLHFVAFVLASTTVLIPLALVRVLPPGIVLGAILLLTMFYFAMVDFLYMGRLAAYASILQTPEEAPTESSRLSVLGSQSKTTLPSIPPSDDDILSDVPGLVPPPESPSP